MATFDLGLRTEMIRNWFAEVPPYAEADAIFHRSIGPAGGHEIGPGCWCCPVRLLRTDFPTAEALVRHLAVYDRLN